MESRVQPHPQTHERNESRRTPKIAAYLWLCALTLAAVIPFANRAVHLDEPQYLHVANSALQGNWAFPQDTEWLFFGKRYPHLAAQTHLPIVEYYLAALLKIVGGFDVQAFRLSFSVFPLIAVVSFYRLANRFTESALLVSSLFAVSPAFFVLSPTLMMDIPMLAFLLAGLSLYLEHDSPLRLCGASICFILAAGTGYTVLVPLACLLMWTVWRRRPLREWIVVGSAPAAVLVWLVVMELHFGESPASELVGYYTSNLSFIPNILPLFSFFGGVALFPWIFIATNDRTRIGVWIIASVVAALALSFAHAWPSISDRLWFVVLASSGIGLLMLFAKRAWELFFENDPIVAFLVTWLVATLAFFVVFAEMISARYILLSLPPLFLVIFRHLTPSVGVPMIAAGLLLSTALSVSDYRFVNAYPEWVEREVIPLERMGFRIWNGSEAGLRFYLERKGIETLDNLDLRPRGGDFVVRQKSFEYGLAEALGSVLINTYATELRDTYPLRTFSREAGAGFHDSHFGVVPFAFSRAPLDRLQIVQVSPFVAELPQAVPEDFSSVPVWSPDGVLLKQVQPEMKFQIQLPADARIDYEIEGQGSVQLSGDWLILKKETPGPVVWQNFRIIPARWVGRD